MYLFKKRPDYIEHHKKLVLLTKELDNGVEMTAKLTDLEKLALKK